MGYSPEYMKNLYENCKIEYHGKEHELSKIIYNKAVRDKIPEIIRESGVKCSFKVLLDSQFLEELEKKLDEEIREYLLTKNVEELADIVEVVYRISELKNTSRADLDKIRKKKEIERGAYRENLFLEENAA